MHLRIINWKPVWKKRPTWDEQYLNGKWDGLASECEEARFDPLRKFVEAHAANSRILEIGCGEGILQSRPDPSIYAHYLGIDISSVAIERARQLQQSRTRYLVGDMDTFQPDEQFDIIIFNESLYYARNPCQTMKRYMQHLHANGIFITSIYETTSNKRLIKKLTNHFTPFDSSITVNEKKRWHCHLYRKA